MTDKQPEALRLADTLDLAPENGIEPQTSEDAAAELRRQHAEIESLQATIEIMVEEHADELMVAHMDGRMRAAQPAPQQEAQEPVAWYVTGCGRLLDEDEAKAEARHIGGTARAIPLYTMPQADSVTAPAAGAVAHTISDAQIEAMPMWRNFVGLWPESRREIVDAVVDLLAAAPTTQPAPQQEAQQTETGFSVSGATYAELIDLLMIVVCDTRQPERQIQASRMIGRIQRDQPAPQQEALRLAKYVARRKLAKQLDANEIHGFDSGCDTEAVLLLSDIEAVLSQVAALTAAQPAADALAEAEYFIDNPSAWSSFDQRASDAIAAVCKAFRAARAPADSVTAPASGANWQDISTAPKDGTRFVAVGQNYGLDSEKQHTCIAQWLAGCWVEVSDWNGASKLKYLTHWMPLPPLPCSAARGQDCYHEQR